MYLEAVAAAPAIAEAALDDAALSALGRTEETEDLVDLLQACCRWRSARPLPELYAQQLLFAAVLVGLGGQKLWALRGK